MEKSFATFILEEKDWARKMEIMYYLSKKGTVFFDKSVILKTEIAKLFMDAMKIEDVDQNIVITACLLCNCKKPIGFTEIDKVKSYAKEGAEYLKQIGFEDRFCKICREVNRYSEDGPREKESDILELVDNFGGMISERFDRAPIKPDEALMLLEYRNLRNKENRYLNQFIDFIQEIQRVHIGLKKSMEYLSKLIKESKTTKIALINAYNSESKIMNGLEDMRTKTLPGLELKIDDIKINPEDIEKIIL